MDNMTYFMACVNHGVSVILFFGRIYWIACIIAAIVKRVTKFREKEFEEGSILQKYKVMCVERGGDLYWCLRLFVQLLVVANLDKVLMMLFGLE